MKIRWSNDKNQGNVPGNGKFTKDLIDVRENKIIETIIKD